MNDSVQQQPTPVNIQMQPATAPGFDIYALLMQAHTSSLQNAADIRNHLKECNDRDRRNELMFRDTEMNVGKLFSRIESTKDAIDKSLSKVADEVNTSNRWVYMIVGGITLGGVLLEKFDVTRLLSGH